MNSIFHRVSVRKFQEKEVESDKLELILRAGMQAPSAYNLQPWEFYVVRNREVINELSQVSKYLPCAKNAPLVIVSVYRENVRVPQYNHINLSIAMENMWLEADSLGLGAVWLGVCPFEENMLKVDQILHLPQGLRTFALLAVGYPLTEPKAQQDRFQAERIHYVD